MNPSWGRRLAGIEGLRAVAAVSVMTEHTWLYAAGGPWLSGLGRWMPNLGNGLTLFFVLSGFLLYRPFAVAMAGAGPAPRLGAYARNRVLRIYPAYVVALLATALVLQDANVPAAGGGRALGALHDPVALGANLALFQSFFPSTLFTGIDPARTLCAELTFYAALPLLAFAGYRVARRRSAAVRMLAPAVAMCAAGFGTVAVLVATGHPRAVHHGTWGEVFEQSLLPVAGLFGLGMGVAAIGVLGAQRWAVAPRALRRGALATAILSAGLGACLTAYAVVDPRVCHMVWGVAAAALILAVGLAPERRSRLVGALETRPMVFVGLASYGLYLWHEPLIYFLRAHHATATGGRGMLVDLPLVAAVAIAVAAASYRWVERPALRRKRRTDRDVPAQAIGPLASPALGR